MSRFIESIRIANGIIENLSLHQERLNRALKEHSVSSHIDLEDHIKIDVLDDHITYKCRIEYDLDKVQDIQYIPYEKRVIRSLGIVREDNIEYRHKYANRDNINRLLALSKADDVIIVKDGHVTDASYTNLVFYDGKDWYTSNTPLLRGVQREKLIRNETIKETVIKENDIRDFTSLRMINAMIPWEEAIELHISAVVFPG